MKEKLLLSSFATNPGRNNSLYIKHIVHDDEMSTERKPKNILFQVREWISPSHSLSPILGDLHVSNSKISDPMAWVGVSLEALEQLSLLNGAYVQLSHGDKKQVAQLVVVSNTKKNNMGQENNVCFLSPLVLFNLGIQMNNQPFQVGIEEYCYVSSMHKKAACNLNTIAVAQKVVISQVLCSFFDSQQQLSNDEVDEAVKEYFSKHTRILGKGYLIAVPVSTNPVSSSLLDKPICDWLERIPSASSVEGHKVFWKDPKPDFCNVKAIIFFRVNNITGEKSGSNNSQNNAFFVSTTDSKVSLANPSSSCIPIEEKLRQYFLAIPLMILPQSSNITSKPNVSNFDFSRISQFYGSSLSGLSDINSYNKLYNMLSTLTQESTVHTNILSLLLSGASGVGKRSLVYSVAKDLGIYVKEVCFTDLSSSSDQEVIQNIQHQFELASKMSPSILYIRRFFSTQKENEDGELRIAAALSHCLRANVLKANCNFKKSSRESNLAFIASLEDVEKVPKFIRQCFLYEMKLQTPNETQRLKSLEHMAAKICLHKDVKLEKIAHETAGRTFGELSALLADAGTICMKRTMLSSNKKMTEAKLYSFFSSTICKSSVKESEFSIREEDLEIALKNQQTASSLSLGSNSSIPNIKWEDVGGLQHVKEEILDMVQLPLKHPELFASGLRQRSGILLYGPPGTGKTLLAKAIATECNLNFISVKGPELLNMYIGESEKNVRQVFQKARDARPCILFFDELDSLAPMRGRGSDSGGVMDRIVSQLLSEIDGIQNNEGSENGSDDGGAVFVVGATNRPDLLETALLRPGRFDRLLYLGMSADKTAQLKILHALTRKFRLHNDVDLEKVVENCPMTFTGADFYALCSSCLSFAIKERVDETEDYISRVNQEDCYSTTQLTVSSYLNKLTSEELQVQCRMDHFMQALGSIKPSVSQAELEHYEKLQKQFCSRKD